MMQMKKRKKTTSGARKLTLEQITTFLTVAKVARRFHVQRPTVIRWIQKGQLAATKSPVDGRWLIDPKDLDKFHRVEPGNPDWIAKRWSK